MADHLTLIWQSLEIVWINLLLSGDNAILIALACRSLPEKQKRIGFLLGAAGAVGLRLIFTLAVEQLLELPVLKIGGGLFVIWLAMVFPRQSQADHDVAARPTLWGAVRAIIVADAVMSLDNVLALAAAAHGSMQLIVFGLLLSAPLVMFGAQALAALMTRLKWLIPLGAAILGWAGGALVATDPLWPRLGFDFETFEIGFGLAGAAIALLAGWSDRKPRAGADLDPPEAQ